MNGARRVVVFCILTVLLPTILIIIPLYLTNNVFIDALYEVAESDVLEVGDDISPIFCQGHTLKMNGTFSAYQVDKKPEISNKLKHIQLNKSMRLPDDTLEYWGFFLPKGSVVKLTTCSRYVGSQLLVVRGKKSLNTCGLLDHSKKKTQELLPVGEGDVRVRFELNVQMDPVKVITTPAPPDDDENNGGEDLVDEVDKWNAHNEHKLKIRHLRGLLEDNVISRRAREAHMQTQHNLDRKNIHGGVAANQTDDDDSSVSSFEQELFECYGKDILLKQEFPSSQICGKFSDLLSNHTTRMVTTHAVPEDGYYFYIFYSDNDLVKNDIHAQFNIHKPTYQYSNISKTCINKTICTFPVTFLSKEIVIVEVPTRDGIEDEAEDISILVSVCQPRMAVYVIFPLLVLILILGCAFL